MRRSLIIVLSFLGCTQVNNQEETISKRTLVIGHYQTFEHSFIPDISKGNLIMNIIIPPPIDPSSDSLKAQRMHDFVRDVMGNCAAVYFYKKNRIKRAVTQFPFCQSVSRYDGVDSSHLYIDSILSDGRAYMRFDNSVIAIDAGDSTIVIDSLKRRPDTNYCWERIIITHKIVNYGFSVLPDKKFNQFF